VVFPYNNLLRYDFALDVARGEISNMSHVNILGRNPDADLIASSTAVNLGRSLWDGGIAGAVNWVAPTTARTHAIVSSSANDDTDGGGTNNGARTVQVLGLDSAYALQQENVTLNGTGSVNTASTYTMIYRMLVLTAGGTGWNEGAITATAATDGTVTAKITATNNQTLSSQFMVPAGKKAYMTSYHASIEKKGLGSTSRFGDIFLMSKQFGGVWRVRDTTTVDQDGSSYVPHTFNPYKVFEAKELIELRADPSEDAQDISGGYDLILVDS